MKDHELAVHADGTMCATLNTRLGECPRPHRYFPAAEGELPALPLSAVTASGVEGFVVDLDTGTVLGANLVFVFADSLTSEEYMAVYDPKSDAEVQSIAERYGRTLVVNGRARR